MPKLDLSITCSDTPRMISLTHPLRSSEPVSDVPAPFPSTTAGSLVLAPKAYHTVKSWAIGKPRLSPVSCADAKILNLLS